MSEISRISARLGSKVSIFYSLEVSSLVLDHERKMHTYLSKLKQIKLANNKQDYLASVAVFKQVHTRSTLRKLTELKD